MLGTEGSLFILMELTEVDNVDGERPGGRWTLQ